MRFALLGAIGALALLSAAATGAQGAPARDATTARARTAKPVDVANLRAPSGPFRDTVLRHAPSRRFYDSPPTAYLTADHMTVYVVFSSLYTPDAATAQKYVDLLGWLTHGPELNGLYVYIYTPAEIDVTCGSGAAACYSPQAGAMWVPGEDVVGGIAVEQAVAHEYGHHIARHRLNPPWAAEDWGPKRWATYENVCANVAAGQMFPGAEPPDPHYSVNPGEGWAEGYRYLNEQRAGNWPPIGWVVVDPYFTPDANLLRLISLDVTKPWTGPTTYVKKGRFTGRGKRQWKFLPYDGPMSATVTGPRGTTVSFLVKGKVARGPARRVSGVVCGAPSVTVRVQSTRAGRFTLRVSEDTN